MINYKEFDDYTQKKLDKALKRNLDNQSKTSSEIQKPVETSTNLTDQEPISEEDSIEE